MTYHFYAVFLKKNFDGKIKYGHKYYDFDKGTMTFYKPKQLIVIEDYKPSKISGWALVFHPDFIQNHPLSKKLKDYGFFSYDANEALHLSDGEESLISNLLLQMQQEIELPIDRFSQDVLIAHIDLFLNYCNRFYNRQFITRKQVSNEILSKFEQLLLDYTNEKLQELGPPQAAYFAENLHVSVSYLNDLLKNLTGQTVQQHVHEILIQKVKDLLATTDMTTSQISYALGFEYAQSFNKLFKNKTLETPQEYRKRIN